MLGAETEEKLFDAPLSISKREQLEQQVERDDAWVGEGTWSCHEVLARGLLSPSPRPAVAGMGEAAGCPRPATSPGPTGPRELLLRARPGPSA